jgi:predicted O-methyltransferase YrrM
MEHLQSYDDHGAIGPLQQDEAVALFGLVRALRPRTVVEFGFFHGHSAFNFLMALEADALLASYDVDDGSRDRAAREFPQRPGFRFFHKSQEDFHPDDVDGRPLDLVFFDAAHFLDLNQRTFERVRPHLAPGAWIAIHDTGVWSPEHLEPVHEEFIATMPIERTREGRIVHQPGEREFVRWILEHFPEFQALHLHSCRTLRHGLTFLQIGPGFPDEAG